MYISIYNYTKENHINTDEEIKQKYGNISLKKLSHSILQNLDIQIKTKT
jgi:hypothetical protein